MSSDWPGPSPGPPIPAVPPRPRRPPEPPAPSRQLIEHHAGPPRGTATRYLCAAGYLDRTFRDAVIAELVEHPYRVPAPSPGTELVRVLHECLRARRAPFLAGLAMLGVLAFGVLSGHWSATLPALLTVALLRLIGAGASAATVVPPDETVRARSSARRTLSAAGQLAAAVVLAGMLVSVWVPTQNGRTLFEREVLPRLPADTPFTVTAPGLAAYVLELGRGREYPGDVLHRLTVGDRVFRPGLRRGPATDWLGGMSAPVPGTGGAVKLDHRWATALDLFGHERLRRFLTIRAGSWQEEVVTTVLVRAITQGKVLHLEWQPYLLPPTATAYRVVDSFAPLDLLADGPTVMGQAAWGLGRDMGAAIGQIFRTWASAARAMRHRGRYRRLVRNGYAVNHAPAISVREFGAEEKFQNVFQEADVQRFLSTVWVRTQTAVLTLLKERGYDVSAFEQQAQNIVNNNINNGTQINGGTQHGPVAGGPGARARVTPPQPRVGARSGSRAT
ncbi:membrane protein [Streptomyces chrestomyceticus JCM 4735]|uniref:Membrane protein n=1 Tax=Streptomyces chrestomyceticus JCM 4735 TaxID=1306181 RepID=A0A7U9Q371_9ACTN|nr:hypothetical protein [Streptomyces chrestomyceticus]GCD40195.1 membrane protein [Streptomyces chrestomyceticus JCM 4735]